MNYRTDFRKSVHVETGVDPCLRYYRNYIISLTFCFGKKKQLTVENKWIWVKWPVWISLAATEK